MQITSFSRNKSPNENHKRLRATACTESAGAKSEQTSKKLRNRRKIKNPKNKKTSFRSHATCSQFYIKQDKPEVFHLPESMQSGTLYQAIILYKRNSQLINGIHLPNLFRFRQSLCFLHHILFSGEGRLRRD